MDYKTRSVLVIGAMIIFMVSMGVLMNTLSGSPTGAAVSCGFSCVGDSDCSDGNTCTSDECVKSEQCGSHCVNTVADCGAADGCCPKNCADMDMDC